MKIEITKIDEALEYYKIENIEYKNKCHKCIEDIKSIDSLHSKAEEVYQILYKDNTFKIDNLWQVQNTTELFGKNSNPFITNILVLLGYEIHETNMNVKGYTNRQKLLYKQRVNETLTNDIFVRKLEGIRISQMIWAVYFIRTRIIEVGRLQYENGKDGINIHIPAGEKLEIEKVVDSIQKSKKEIEKYFAINDPKYYCHSWLLSNQLNAIIDSNSNIAKFYNLFDVKDGEEATKDILNFVFQIEKCNDYSSLEESTSLQKLIKQQLIKNKKFKIGLGTLKNRGEEDNEPKM